MKVDSFKIISLSTDSPEMLDQAARILVDAFKEHWPNAWPTLSKAQEEVNESLNPGRITRAAVSKNGTVLGWVGAIPEYDGNTWELHPLAVHPNFQGNGVGRALVSDLEERILEHGGITIFLGTDDEDNMTSLGGVNLYPCVFESLLSLENKKRHPYEFYQKMGYVIVGVIPDANGFGKPDIIMAKSITKTYL